MTTDSKKSKSLWIDVTTSFRWKKKPTGIPRTCNSLAKEFLQLNDTNIKFCVFDSFSESFFEVPKSEVQSLLSKDRKTDSNWSPDALLSQLEDPAKHMSSSRPKGRLHELGKKLIRKAPLGIQQPLRNIIKYSSDLVAQFIYIFNWMFTNSKILPGFVERKLSWFGEIPGLSRIDFEEDATLVAIGSSWSETNYNKTVESLIQNNSLKFVPLIYDLIPYRYPQFFDSGFSKSFSEWIVKAISLANKVLCISENTKKDIQHLTMKESLHLPETQAVKLGMNICDQVQRWQEKAPKFQGSFVLCVGTIEVRKNHWTLYHAWSNLIEELGKDKVPTLVLAGQPGWLSNDIVHLIKNSPSILGRILIPESLSDNDVNWLYNNCLFTVYPSFYEGWGLPVAEALAVGKYCIASSASSLPEIGGELIDYCAPTDVVGWTSLIKRALVEPGYVLAKEEEIKKFFQPQDWAKTAQDLLEFLKIEIPKVGLHSVFHPSPRKADRLATTGSQPNNR